jgi:myo-inositol-hexaphosphate 3-phosphohydrolase
MLGIDAIDVAIAVGKKRGTLTLRPFATRFDTTAWSVSDEHGVLFVEDEKAEAVKRVFGSQAGPGSFGRLVQQHKEED